VGDGEGISARLSLAMPHARPQPAPHAPHELSEADQEALDEPFVQEYLHYEPPRPLPSRPPSRLLAPDSIELVVGSLWSTLTCGVGGLVWGTLAGSLASARARRPVWRSALITAGASAAFEGFLQLKAAILNRARTVGRPDAVAANPPAYTTLRGLAFATSADIGVSAAALLALVQPSRAPLSFGGWAVGR